MQISLYQFYKLFPILHTFLHIACLIVHTWLFCPSYLSSFFLSKWHFISLNFIIWSVKNSFERGMHNFLVGWHGWHSILINYLYHTNGILNSKLCCPSARKKCSCDKGKILNLEAEGWEFAKILSSLEQFIQTVIGQNNFW